MMELKNMKKPLSKSGLEADLRRLHEHLRSTIGSRWNRDLPFDEFLFDRWDRARSLKFGKKASIYHNSYIYGKPKVGRHTWVGPFTILDGTGKLKIGDYCSISAGVQIYTHDTVRWAVSQGRLPYEYAPVTIGSACFIGSGTIITKGVTIGDHSIVGAGSLVNDDIPPYSIAWGTPAKVIGRVSLKNKKRVSFIYHPGQA
jgi:acetyltransferase-like isoleucine patch superfamily enzyme